MTDAWAAFNEHMNRLEQSQSSRERREQRRAGRTARRQATQVAPRAAVNNYIDTLPQDRSFDLPSPEGAQRADAEQNAIERAARLQVGRDAVDSASPYGFGRLARPFVNTLADPERREALGDAVAGAGRWALSDEPLLPPEWFEGEAPRVSEMFSAENLQEAPRRLGEAAGAAGGALQSGMDWVSEQADPTLFPEQDFVGGIGTLARDYGPGILRAASYGPWEDERRLQFELDVARGVGDEPRADELAGEANAQAGWAGVNAAAAPFDIPMLVRGARAVNPIGRSRLAPAPRGEVIDPEVTPARIGDQPNLDAPPPDDLAAGSDRSARRLGDAAPLADDAERVADDLPPSPERLDASNAGAANDSLGPVARYEFEGPRGQMYEVTIAPDERAGAAAIGFSRVRTDGYAARYRPHNDLTPGEARSVYREVARIVREDAAKHSRSAYGASGYTQRQTGLYEALAETDGPPGYVRDPSAPRGLVFRRVPASPDGSNAGAGQTTASPNARTRRLGENEPLAAERDGAPRDPGQRLLGTAAGAGAVGAGALAFGGDAEAQDGEPLEAARTRVSELEGAAEVFSNVNAADPESVRRAQQALQARGLFVEADGRLGPDTARAIAEYRVQVNEELEEARARLEALELEERSRETRAGPLHEGAREFGPLAATAAGLYFGHRTRLGAVRAADAELAARNARADELLTPGPVRIGRSAADRADPQRRMANINDFWRLGGAGERVPYATAQSARGFKPRAGAAQASELFPPGPERFRFSDAAVPAAALTEAGLSGGAWHLARQELAEAEAAVERDPSEPNLVRLERARDMVKITEAAMRGGLGFAAGRLGGVAFHPYSQARPNVATAERERALLNQYLAPRRAPRKTRRRLGDDE